ncbi:MAG: hypothetical protein AAF743_05270, partial [Planctomycetota bacterium]
MLFALGLILGILLASAAAYFYVRFSFDEPVRHLRGYMKRMRRGEWQLHVEPQGAMAVRKLGHRLNQLANAVRRQLADGEQRRGDLTA